MSRLGSILVRGAVIAGLGVLLGATASCGSTEGRGGDAVRTQRTTEALTDQSSAITAKWNQKGGAAVVGTATSAVLPAPHGLAAQYQTFTNGVIVSSDTYGAFELTTEIFNKWVALDSQFDAGGNSALLAIGLPISDLDVLFFARQSVAFEHGRIMHNNGAAQAIYGAIYGRWVAAADGLVGRPMSDEATELNAGRVQVFEGGEIHWSPSSGAWEMKGDFLDYWAIAGGETSSIGFPTSSPQDIMNGTTVIGSRQTFQNETLVSSPATGVVPMSGAILVKWNQAGGATPIATSPNPPLGFPLAPAVTTAKGDHYQNFQNGVIVDSNRFFGAQAQYVFSNDKFFASDFSSGGPDCSFPFKCGGLDPYWRLHVYENVPVSKELYPPILQYGNGDDPEIAPDDSHNLPIFTGDLSLSVVFSGKDVDDIGEDDHFGPETYDYSIDNLWGFAEDTEHHISTPGKGTLYGTFGVQSNLPYDPNDFGHNLWWSYKNFDTEELSYTQFGQTFTDVDPDETVYEHPFNHLFYSAFYKTLAKPGNCFGMDLAAIYASRKRSVYAEPIHQFFPDTQNGETLAPDGGGPHDGMISVVNILHGYQLGASNASQIASQFLGGKEHNPVDQWEDGAHYQQHGMETIVGLTSNYLFGDAHSVLAINYDDTGVRPCQTAPNTDFCIQIDVMNPNRPYTPTDSPNDFIEIDTNTNHYYFTDGSTQYRGDSSGGGRLYVMPFTSFDEEPATLYDKTLELLNDGILVLMGSSGTVNQATDDQGRTLFQAPVAGPPQWADLVPDPSDRIALAPIQALSYQATTQPVQMYLGKNVTGASHSFQFGPAAGMGDGVAYEVSVETAQQSAALTIPGTAGKSDLLTASNIGTDSKAFELGIPNDGVAKAVTFTISGFEKQRWAEFSALGMSPAQKLKMHTEHAGYRVQIDNNGPATSAFVRVKGGVGATPISLGTVSIPAGHSTVDFQNPQTSITVTNQVFGNAGWLIAPVTITLNAVVFSDKGLDATEYSTDGTNWTTYTGPFQYAAQGATLLYYRSRDKDFNQESAKTQPFMIDTQQPAANGTLAVGSTVQLNYTAADPIPGSGLSLVHFITQDASGPVSSTTTQATGSLTLTTQCSRVELWADDVAGNTQTPHVVIQDTRPPVFKSFPTTVTSTKCTVAAGLPLGTVTATDDCGTPTVTSDAPAHFPLGTTIVTYTATDAAGNVTKATQTVTTTLGDDQSCCPVGSKIIMGTPSNDNLVGTSGPDCIIGLGGQDTIHGMGGNDAISGGDGDDSLWGGDGNDIIFGGTGQDTINGEAGNDLLYGDDGVDTIHGNDGDDILHGGQGTDHMFCDAGNDQAYGDGDDDQIDGGPGNDYLNGGANHDTYNGGGGSDQCVQDGGDTLGGSCTAVTH